MVSSFNLVKLKELLKDLYTVTGLRITVFDTNYVEVLSYPDPLPDFCKLIRTSPQGAHNCYVCDEQGCLASQKTDGVYIYKCHAGLTEVIAPLVLGKITIGYLCFGHILPDKDLDDAWRIVKEKISAYNLDEEIMHEKFKESTYLSDEYLKASAQILLAVASYACVNHLMTLKADDMPLQIDSYINENLASQLDSDILCEHFKISRAKLYQISMSNFGMGITEYIRSLRTRKAEDLLRNTTMPINAVAQAVGINDYNYFTKVFKRETGRTPSGFRKLSEEEGFWTLK